MSNQEAKVKAVQAIHRALKPLNDHDVAQVIQAVAAVYDLQVREIAD